MDLIKALSGWLQQIVAVVLLAGLVDLMLPNRTMQRYVRLVAGLIILLTVAGPLLQWIRSDVTDRLAAGLDAFDRRFAATGAELARIEEAGRKWRERGNQQSLALAAEQLEYAIGEDVRQLAGREAEAVKAVLRQQPDGSIVVQSVEITLTDRTDRTEASREEAADDAGIKPDRIGLIQPVEPVMPVVVDAVESAQQRRQVTGFTDPDPVERQRIVSLVSAKYGIAENRIRVALVKISADQGG
jgi:stage III sporulation protein AF